MKIPSLSKMETFPNGSEITIYEKSKVNKKSGIPAEVYMKTEEGWVDYVAQRRLTNETLLKRLNDVQSLDNFGRIGIRVFHPDKKYYTTFRAHSYKAPKRVPAVNVNVRKMF